MDPDVGLELVNPAAGSTVRFTATAASTDGAYCEVEVTYAANSSPPPRHLHPAQDEHFTVLSGRMLGNVGDIPVDAGAGESFDVPRGTSHLMGAGPEGATIRWRTTPALRTDEMFCALWQVAHDNDWKPDVMQLFAVTQEFGDEFRLC